MLFSTLTTLPLLVAPVSEDVEASLASATAAIDAIVAMPEDERTFSNSVLAIDDVQARAFMDTRMTSFLANVSTDAAVRERGRDSWC